MKTKLVKPDLSSVELTKLNFYANYLGWLLKFNREKQSALFDTEDKHVGYIQKDEFNHLFIVWKHNEEIEFIDDKINICMKMDNIKIAERGFEFIDIKSFAIGVYALINKLV
jgi:hypothetical protein